MFGTGGKPWGKGVQKPDRDLPAAKRLGALAALSQLRIFQFLENAILKAEANSAQADVDEKTISADLDSKIRRVPPEHYKENLRTMIQVARANEIMPVLLTQAFNPKQGPQRNIHREIQKKYNEMIIEVAENENVLYVDPGPSLETDASLFTSNTHPSVRGHRKIARLIANALIHSLRSN